MAQFEVIVKKDGNTKSVIVEADASTTTELMENYDVQSVVDGEITAVTKYKEKKLNYFERQRRVKEHAAQSGWDFVTGNPSY